jgi:hypothetical protein
MPEHGMEKSNITSQKKFKTQPLVGEVMSTLLWDAEGSILKFYQERGTTVNSVHYSEMTGDHLKSAI